MEAGFIWNDKHSNEKNIKVITLPPITSVDERVEKITVPGRNGYLIKSDNSYEGDVKEVTFDFNGVDVDALKKWLLGSGRVRFSNEPDRYYKARIINKVSLEQVVGLLHTGLIQFDCQPFGYLLVGDEIIELTKPEIIYNPGTIYSEPYIKIYGNGDITLKINENSLIIKEVNEYVEIDTELDEIYKGTISWENHTSGDTPIFEGEDISIDWTGNVIKIEIIPHWRCI